MPTLTLTNFNIVCAVLGGFITIFGLISYLLKEHFYLSEALISTLAGIIFSPHATNWIRPSQLVGRDSDPETLEQVTLYFSRLVLGVQLVLAGVQLPSKYLYKEWRSLSLLLGPGMCAMWMITSLLVWGLTPHCGILQALAVGACVTPTDPVLSNSIVKGKFADKNIPVRLQRVIIAESGANDGLGYPFLFLALYLIRGRGMGIWFYETWAYVILMSVAYGAVVGWLAKELLHWAEERKFVDRESFLVFAITLALFITGTCGLLSTDDVLACFIAGNVFTWDDWFRLETEDDSFQPTIDMLLNVAVFMWIGATCPWHKFAHNEVIGIGRLIGLGICVLLLRRLPVILTLKRWIDQIGSWKEACYMGFFGPVGISAVFYLFVAREFLREEKPHKHSEDTLAEMLEVEVWFLIICSIFVHGLAVPLTKLGVALPRTLSRAVGENSSTSVDERRGVEGLRGEELRNAISAPVPARVSR
ncbi:Na/H antiporter [Piedraia hortae CBS 480.64]|uniref:Na/H antiporter n=1 Tax=Piedraia hortae CBS 480.64 TaxID=1314780 RepID=A0A6A7C2J5_9PEZI|nr:Na/H antiporter [Piedraia hortae CBS 480.64]